MKTASATQHPWLRPLSRRAKLSMVISAILFLALCLGIRAMTREYVISKAETELQDLLLHHRGIHQYVQHDMRAELDKLRNDGHIPNEFYSPVLSSSSYMVRNMHEYVNQAREAVGEDRLYYKMAATNPRNPVNRADPNEEKLLQRFNQDHTLQELREVIVEDGRHYLQVALPFLTTDQACLKCHGNREDAPPQLQELYLGQGGFGDKIGNIRAVECIRVPLDQRLSAANIALIAGGLGGLCFIGLVGFNRKLKYDIGIQTGKLQESEERFRAAFESAADCIVIFDQQYKCLYANQAAIDHVETTRDKLIGKTIRESLQHIPDFMELWISRLDQIFQTKQGFSVQDKTDLFGTKLYSESVVTPVYDSHGQVVAASIVYRDVTERRKAEEELRELRNYLSNIIDSMPSTLVGVDSNGNVTQWNSEAQRSTGLSPKEAIGKPLGDVFPRLNNELHNVREAMRTRQVQTDTHQMRNDGDEIHYEDITVYPLVANGVEGAVIRVDDVTERVRLEEMMIQSEKMVSVGGLAAGMAHEINNPLGGMMQAAQNIEHRLAHSLPANSRIAQECGVNLDAVRNYLERRQIFTFVKGIRECGARAADIVSNMLQFSRKSPTEFQPTNLAELINKTVELASQDYDLKKCYDFRKIEIVREFDPDLPPVPVIATELEQVILNLLRNGAQAMQDNPPEKKATFTLRTQKQGHMARIEVEDTGPGIPESIRRRIFEPFFTTKEVGVGTGLGLSVSYMIVTQNHSGEMTAESIPGHGAKFIILLPRQQLRTPSTVKQSSTVP